MDHANKLAEVGIRRMYCQALVTACGHMDSVDLALTVMPQRACITHLICSSLSRTLPCKKAGAFGLPKLKESSKTRPFEDFDNGIYFEVPVAWVKRKNTLRPGVYFSNFDVILRFEEALNCLTSGDRAVLEIFSDKEESALEQQLVSHFVNPAAEVGGDSRLMSPSSNRIKSATEKTSTQTYTYVDFPTETITRSGYQIKQKNFGVAVKKKGTVYTLVSSARSDKYDKAKEELLRGIIRSFRLDE